MEQSLTKNIVDRDEQISRAAAMNFDRNFHNVAQLIGYRQRVAQDILRGGHSVENYKYLNDIFDHTNRQIETILALNPEK